MHWTGGSRHRTSGAACNHKRRKLPPMATGLTPFKRKAQLGFTLLELLVVVAIAGVLATVAYPAFQDSIRKGRRSDATAGLTVVQQAQERWRANKPAYASDAQLSLGVNANPPGLGLASLTSGGYYNIAVSEDLAAGYTATATAVAGKSQASDGNCAQLRVRVVGGNIIYGSASIGSSDFDESSGNRCWAK